MASSSPSPLLLAFLLVPVFLPIRRKATGLWFEVTAPERLLGTCPLEPGLGRHSTCTPRLAKEADHGGDRRGPAEADVLSISCGPELDGGGRNCAKSAVPPLVHPFPSLNHITEIGGLPQVSDFPFLRGVFEP